MKLLWSEVSIYLYKGGRYLPTSVLTSFLANRDPAVMSVHKYIIRFSRRIYRIITDGYVSMVRSKPNGQ